MVGWKGGGMKSLRQNCLAISNLSTDEGSEPCVPMSLEDEILGWGVLDKQNSGGVLDGKVLYCLLVSLRRWRGNPLLVCWSSMMAR